MAVTRPGLEGVCAEECRSLGLRVVGEGPGAVRLSVTDRELALAVRWLRTATRVLLDVADLHAPTFGALERAVRRVDWSAFVAAGTTPVVRVRARAAQLHHTGAVEQRVLDAIATASGDGNPPTPSTDLPTDDQNPPTRSTDLPTDDENPPTRSTDLPVGDENPPTRSTDLPVGDGAALVRLDIVVIGEVAHVRADATGDPADRRGWRLATAKAPLPPTVAAAALRAIGWDGTVPLLDPLCGSGTIGIEAALLAAGRAPAANRAFAVQAWPSFPAGTWASAAVPPAAADRSSARVPILIGDRDAGAVEAARGNAERAGVADLVDIRHQALRTAVEHMADLPAGWILTNPPWGRRIEGDDGDLRDLHAALGRLVTEHPGWRLAVITADPATARHAGVPLDRRWRTSVGGTRVALLASPDPRS